MHTELVIPADHWRRFPNSDVSLFLNAVKTLPVCACEEGRREDGERERESGREREKGRER